MLKGKLLQDNTYHSLLKRNSMLTELVFSVVPYTVTDRTVGMKDSYLLNRVSNSNTLSGCAWTSRTTIPLPDLPSLY